MRFRVSNTNGRAAAEINARSIEGAALKGAALLFGTSRVSVDPLVSPSGGAAGRLFEVVKRGVSTPREFAQTGRPFTREVFGRVRVEVL